jgi:hypothetical protein
MRPPGPGPTGTGGNCGSHPCKFAHGRFASDEIEIRGREGRQAGECRERHRRAGAVREASYVATTSKDIDLK